MILGNQVNQKWALDRISFFNFHINFFSMQLQEDGSLIELEQGQLDKSKLRILHPIYDLSINNDFYRNFVASTQNIQGDEKQKYEHMKNRIDKFFTSKSQFQRGYRWNRRIEPDYECGNKQIYPLSHAVMIYGVDYLSNKEIKKILNIPQQLKIIKRLNLSNVVISFSSKNDLQRLIGPFLFDNPKMPFFLPKQQEVYQQEEDIKPPLQNLQKLPKLWYGLRPYQYKDQPMYWFIRYLTNREFIKIPQIKQRIDFREVYDTGSKIYEKKKRIKEEVQNSERNSSYQVLSRSRSNFSNNYSKDRELSRQRVCSIKSSYIQQEYKQQQIYNSNVDSIIPQVERSDILQLSFAVGPQIKLQSQQLLTLMNNMQLNQNKPLTLSNFNDCQQSDQNEMQIVTRGSDPNGLYQKIHYQKIKPIHQLTQVKPNQVWRYNQYKEKILQAEEELRTRKIIPIIVID